MNGDEAEFRTLVEGHRRELQAHCYRMLGSLADAEDALQETLLRAWKGMAGFEGRSSLRTWLYRIATNVCLDLAARRPTRALPNQIGEASPAGTPLAAPVNDPVWLDPAPRDLWEATPENPEAAISARESVGIAFLTLLQKLPASQRAVLLLREVLGFSAAETADLLGLTVSAVNSGLQRARATLDEAPGIARGRPRRDDDTVRALLRRYIEAWETGAPDLFARVLRDDVVFTMPPIPSWFIGVPAVTGLVTWLRANAGEIRCIECWAAGALSVAGYVRPPGDTLFRAAAIHVLTWDGDRVSEIHAFTTPQWFARFGLPETLPG